MRSLGRRLGNAAYGLIVLALLALVGLAAWGSSQSRASTAPTLATLPTPTRAAIMPEWWEPKEVRGVFCLSEADMRLPDIGIANRIRLAHPPVDRATLNEIIPQIQLWQEGVAITPEMMARMRITSTKCMDDWRSVVDSLQNPLFIARVRDHLENPDNPTASDLRQAYLTDRYTQTGPPGAVEIALDYYPVEPVHHDD
jgi:hypothetical protein